MLNTNTSLLSLKLKSLYSRRYSNTSIVFWLTWAYDISLYFVSIVILISLSIFGAAILSAFNNVYKALMCSFDPGSLFSKFNINVFSFKSFLTKEFMFWFLSVLGVSWLNGIFINWVMNSLSVLGVSWLNGIFINWVMNSWLSVSFLDGRPWLIRYVNIL